MGELTVYKASAGSGKTFTLAVEYISHLVKSPRAYRNILAVTFTNKATAEMKERILSELYGIANRDVESEAYLSQIIQLTGMKEEKIRRNAGEALTYILHDYNHFCVETIDSFFQSVMRNLARELDLSPNLNIELDTKIVLNDAVDRMLANLTANSKEMVGILDYIEDRINEDKGWKIEDEIKDFGQNLFNESVMNSGDDLSNQLGDTAVQIQFRHQLRSKKKEIIESGKTIYDSFKDILGKNGFSASDLKSGSFIENYFIKLSNGDLNEKNHNATINKCLENPKEWVKKEEKNGILIDIACSKLYPLLQKAEEFRSKNLIIINSIDLTLQHLNKISLLSVVKSEINKANKENNRFLLAETNNLLHRIVRNDDSSFVFEKIGANIRNIMIDEFQDTSRMQWQNFKMLLIEGLSQGADSLIVGDVKQSIYRWRNGDWEILNNLKNKLQGFPLVEKTLTTNRRSETQIIRFNNAVFTAAKNYFNDIYRLQQGIECKELLNAYKDVEQQSPRDKEKGYVKVSFLGPDPDAKLNYQENTCVQLGKEVKELLTDGVELKDIAILVRKKNNIGQIADYFNNELQIQIVSDEAFRLDASTSVNMLINALRVLSDENDSISLTSLLISYENEVLHHNFNIDILTIGSATTYLDFFFKQASELKLLPLYELLEKLFDLFQLSLIEAQDAYLFSFFDAVMQYLEKNPSDIRSFLNYWDERLCNQTIPSNELDGIRIFTIHTSKGLQFHTVLIPFCDWNQENETNKQLVWCSPKEKPFNKLKIVPINYGQNMHDSIYQDEFLKEQLQLWVDNLNLLYVAFTRAEKNLIIWGHIKKAKSISGLLQTILPKVAEDTQVSLNDEFGLEIGERLPSGKKSKMAKSKNKFLQQPFLHPIKMQSFFHRVEFKQSNRSADFIAGIDEKNSSTRFIDRGKLLHNLFSIINKESDIDTAINRLEFEGVINATEEDEIRTFVHKAFDIPQIKTWYSSDWQLLNERSIIWSDHGKIINRRPDRVMIKKNEVIIVDFKFGKRETKYKNQVKGYMNLLKEMGYQNINGYLWYVTENIIEPVKATEV